MRTLSASLVSVALLAAWPSAAIAQTADDLTGSDGCDGSLATPGDYEHVNDFGDAGQEYWLVVPDDYADIAPAPLIVWLSSGGGDADINFAGWRPYVDDIEALFAVVGTDTAAQKDTETLLALIDQIGADYCVDPRRIHVMGESWSVATVGRLACEAPDRIASFLGGMGGFYSSDCTPERPVPVLAVTGLSDRAGVAWSSAEFARMNGCDAEAVVEDLGSSVTRTVYQGCEADVVHYDIAGVGHAFVFHECVGPGAMYCVANDDFDQLEEALRFFEEHPLPEAGDD
ncbi:MAG: hypothetical protein U9O18_03850 [Chloroflexota bacterium]|nr:hypothetical protein [Chloroflexota bacterium]